MKEFKTIEEQIENLKKKGLTFKNIEEAKNILLYNNYHVLINGYKECFIDSKTNRFLEGTLFEEVYNLYNFDKELKIIILEYILKIENNLKSLISYYFSKYHGEDNYLIQNNFDILTENSYAKQETIRKRIKNIQNLIGTIHSEIAHSVTSKNQIQEYLYKYGYLPLWVLINILSFGKTSIFLELMKQKERIEISKHYKIKEKELIQYTKILAYYRNLCAHDDILYNAKLPKNLYIPDNYYHKILNIEKKNNMYKQGKNDLFALFIVLKVMLPNDEFITFFKKITEKINTLRKDIYTIKINKILDKINFPSNWKEINEWEHKSREFVYNE